MSPLTEVAANTQDFTADPFQASLKGLDAKIVILAVVSAFIHAYLCGAVALLAAAYALISREKLQQIAAIPHIRWLALFAILALAVPPLFGNWLGLAVGAAILVVLVFYLYLRTVMTQSLFNAIVDVACIISLVYFIIALCQRLFGLAPRSPSTFQNANYYSYALELVLMLAFYRYATAKTTGHKTFLVIVALATVAALFMADSRSAWPAIFGGLFVYFVLRRKTVGLLVLIAVYAAGIKLALSFPAIFPRLDSFDVAKFIRTSIWLEALNGIRQHPLFGVGAMGFLHLSEAHKYYHSHNLLLETLISFGVTGTLLLGAYFLLSFRDIWRRYKAQSQNALYPLILAVVAVTSIHGLTDVTILWPQTGILLVLILAVEGLPKKEGSLRLPPSSSPSSS